MMLFGYEVIHCQCAKQIGNELYREGDKSQATRERERERERERDKRGQDRDRSFKTVCRSEEKKKCPGPIPCKHAKQNGFTQKSTHTAKERERERERENETDKKESVTRLPNSSDAFVRRHSVTSSFSKCDLESFTTDK